MSFTPFDDSQTVIVPDDPTRDGYDTSAFDIYRQGVEIINDRFRFIGTQPKMWSGNVNGTTEIVTYGQSVDSIAENAFGLEGMFLDLPRFDPVAYIQLGTQYPSPILTNYGPSQTECVIEPLTIPFRLPTNEGKYIAHDVHAELEDGNNLDSFVVKSASRVVQFVEFTFPTIDRPFLDFGESYFGPINRGAYISDIERKLAPFDDTKPYNPARKLTSTDPTIIGFTRASEALGEQTMIPVGTRSATAGWTQYGRNAGQYGTDSIAFTGWTRGS